MLRVNPEALRLLIKTTMAMAGIPFTAMMLSYHVVLDRLFTFQSAGDKMLYAGVVAICAVQLVVIGFLIAAFREGDGEDGAEKKEQ